MSYYSVAESNRHKAEKEFKKEANKLVSSLLEKVLISGQGFDNVGIKVDAEDVYYYEANKATEHNFSPGIVDKINTAFATPQDLKGSVSVGANNKVVFFASNGELLLDAISLTDSQERTKLEEKFLTLDIEKIISSWATLESMKDKNRPIDEQEMGIFYLIPIETI